MDQEAFQNVFSKALQAFRAAEAAKKARELVRRKSVLTNSTLPGRLINMSCKVGIWFLCADSNMCSCMDLITAPTNSGCIVPRVLL